MRLTLAAVDGARALVTQACLRIRRQPTQLGTDGPSRVGWRRRAARPGHPHTALHGGWMDLDGMGLQGSAAPWRAPRHAAPCFLPTPPRPASALASPLASSATSRLVSRISPHLASRRARRLSPCLSTHPHHQRARHGQANPRHTHGRTSTATLASLISPASKRIASTTTVPRRARVEFTRCTSSLTGTGRRTTPLRGRFRPQLPRPRT